MGDRLGTLGDVGISQLFAAAAAVSRRTTTTRWLGGGHICSYFCIATRRFVAPQGLIGATVFHSISVAQPSLGAL